MPDGGATSRTPTYVWPSLHYSDAPAAIAFLVEGLGFVVTTRYDDGRDTVFHAELRWPAGGGVMLGSAHVGEPGPPADSGSIYVVTDDPDAVYARAVAAGAVAVREPNDTDYGSRECGIRDPAGVHWSFGTYTAAEG